MAGLLKSWDFTDVYTVLNILYTTENNFYACGWFEIDYICFFII